MLGFCCLLKFLKSTGAERCGGVLFSLSFSAIQRPSLWSGGDRLGGGAGEGEAGCRREGGVKDRLAKAKWSKPVETVRGEC